jgi:CheY-like chemotaxis protein
MPSEGRLDMARGQFAHAERQLLEGLEVLVVDDDRDLREVTALVLQSFGAQVVTAAGAADAMAALQQHLPDVILTDIEMPGEDGYTFVRRLRRMPIEGGGRLPVAAVTAHDRPVDRRRALEAGFDAHLGRPEVDSLVRALAALAAHGLHERRAEARRSSI